MADAQGLVLDTETSSGVKYEIWKGSPTEVKNPKEASGSADASWGGELGTFMAGGFEASLWDWSPSELPANIAMSSVKHLY
jgi:hypothetical protein